VRFRRPRPRSLYRWLLFALALMLAPQFVGAAIGISTQQREISESRGADREIAARLASIARLQAALGATEHAVLRDPRAGEPRVGPRVRATLARARDDLHALGAPALEREFAQLETLAAGDLAAPGAVRRLEAPLDRLRGGTAELSDETIADLRAQEATGRSDQRAHVLGILVAYAATLLITLLIARAFIASIRRPLRELRGGARRVGSGDLAHRVELDSFTEFNQVADSFNAMAEALRRSGRELSHRAFHDALTGLANRALLFDRIGHALARRGRDGERDPVGVLYLDLDDFKAFNDSLGHSRGDEVLVEVARRLRGVLRPSDTVARLGGDEFAVLVEDLTEDADATRVAERILLALSAPLTATGRELELRASIGVAVSGAQLDDPDELVRAADLAMCAAKSGGKGRYRAFEPSMLSGTVERLALEHDLRLAIARDELELHYQPVVDLATGRARGVEALARWTHRERGPVYPDVFIPLAERSGLIVPLGRRLLERACAELPALREGLGEPDLIVSVNLAAAELLAPGLTDHIQASLRSAGITPGSLILEITETQLMSDPDAAVARLHELKALGVNLALDDFGTGYSSLAYLRSFPVDALKIDKAFIDNVADPDSDNHALVRAIISLGKTLDLRIVAEGIEDMAQCRELERLHCDRGQGYLFSRPLPRLELVDTFGRRPASRYS
jgi:diguanylate cyclase (GGDEF)-like protein